MNQSLVALAAIHQKLWNEEASLVRMPPGAVPGIDISAFNLHAVRETALGAYLDFERGDDVRAAQALAEVLRHQYRAPGWPWHGTFKVTAEQADPPGADAVEWLHYDPNWRQFLGCILALVDVRFGDRIPEALRGDLVESVGLCVDGEPADRIPEWYTNPRLMHLWLSATVASRRGDAALLREAADGVDRFERRFLELGDVDEYNSPTYDGIDLFALLLWVNLPPTHRHEEVGLLVLDKLLGRMSALFHSEIGTCCGPYIRAYGLLPTEYISLSGMWLSLLVGTEAGLLPEVLNDETDHVHDLFFAPIFAWLLSLREVTFQPSIEPARRYEQSFGEVRSTSLIRPDSCVGFEAGRVPDFAKDQYVPLTLHWMTEPAPAVGCFGLMLTDRTSSVDGVQRDGTTVIDVVVRGTSGVADAVVVTTLDLSEVELPLRLKVGPFLLGSDDVRSIRWKRARGATGFWEVEFVGPEAHLSVSW